MLSGELSTILTGRYVEFEMFTLTFEEYVNMKKFYKKEVDSNLTKEFDNYILEGGSPKAIQYDDPKDKLMYVKSVIDEIYKKDIKKRVKIKNKEAFIKVQTYIINNFGAPTNISNIKDELKKLGINIKREHCINIFKY